MRTDLQPAVISGLAGGGADTNGATIPGKASWLCKYLGGAGGDWDLYFPGAKRAYIAGVTTSATALLSVTTPGPTLPARVSIRNTANAPSNATFYFTAQVWY